MDVKGRNMVFTEQEVKLGLPEVATTGEAESLVARTGDLLLSNNAELVELTQNPNNGSRGELTRVQANQILLATTLRQLEEVVDPTLKTSAADHFKDVWASEGRYSK